MPEVKLLDGPMMVEGGRVLRVLSVDGKAIPEAWENGGWVEVDGSELAEAISGRPVPAAELEELGID